MVCLSYFYKVEKNYEGHLRRTKMEAGNNKDRVEKKHFKHTLTEQSGSIDIIIREFINLVKTNLIKKNPTKSMLII